jgi:putative metallopeptidase DUF4344
MLLVSCVRRIRIEAKPMSSFQWKTSLIGALIINALIGSNWSFAQSQSSLTTIGQPGRVSIAYVPPESSAFQELYDFLQEHRALERIQEILSPFRSPEELMIKTAECKEVNSWYRRESFKPTVTICYEFLKRILESLPNETNADGLTPADARLGSFSGLLCMRSDMQHSIFSRCQYLDMRRMPPTILQHTSCFNLARGRHTD